MKMTMQSMPFLHPRKRASLQECGKDDSERGGSSSLSSSWQQRLSSSSSLNTNTTITSKSTRLVQLQQQQSYVYSTLMLLAIVLLTTTLLLGSFITELSINNDIVNALNTAADTTSRRMMTTTKEAVVVLMEEPEPLYGHHARVVVTLMDHADHIVVVAVAATTAADIQEAGTNATTTTIKKKAKKHHRRKVQDMRSNSDSDPDDPEKPFAFEIGDCQAQHAWQKQSYMTCNSIHERDLTRPFIMLPSSSSTRLTSSNNNNKGKAEAAIKLIARGDWRDVWVIHNDGAPPAAAVEHTTPVVMKTLRLQNSFTEDTLARQRIDALIMERLTASPYVMDIYGHCGMSGLVEYAPGAVDIATTLWPGIKEDEELDGDLQEESINNLTKLELLHIGVQASMGLAALHNFDVEGIPSVAHTDISPNQFVKVGNMFRLNDFNRARLLTKNTKTQEVCTYREGTNRGKNRSPEEYAYKPQTAMVDIYSLGNIFYMLLMQNYPFRNTSSWRRAAELIQDGQRPVVWPHIWNSTDLVDQALKTAMLMCHAQEPEDRATARQVETYLLQELQRLDPGRLESWGVAVKSVHLQ